MSKPKQSFKKLSTHNFSEGKNLRICWVSLRYKDVVGAIEMDMSVQCSALDWLQADN